MRDEQKNLVLLVQTSMFLVTEESLCTGFDKVIKETRDSNGETTQTRINIDGIYLPRLLERFADTFIRMG